MRLTTTIIALLLSLATMAAGDKEFGQIYVADHLTRDSVELWTVGKSRGEADAGVFKVPNGDTLRLAGMDGKHPIVEWRGQRYTTYASRLRHVGGGENVIQDDNEARYHSDMGHLFYTYVPLVVILVLLLAAGVMMLVVRRAATMRAAVPPLAVLMGLLLAASIIEVMLLVYTDDITWWCDKGSFWQSLLALLPAMLGLGVQLYVGFGIKGKLEELTGTRLSLKAAFVSVPLALVLTIVVAIMHFGGFVQGLVFLGTLAVCAVYSWLRNRRGLGGGGGLAYTLFNFVYVVGALVAFAMLVVLVWSMFLIVLPYLIMGAAAVLAVALMSSSDGRSSGGSSGRAPGGDQWTNIDGHWGTKHSDGSFTTGGETFKRDGVTGEWRKK